MEKIILEKLNRNYASDPNVAEPQLVIYGNKVRVRFQLNSFIYAVPEESYGEVVFTDCMAFRVGKPNDEGYYKYLEHSIWNAEKFPNIEWDSLYKVTNLPLDYYSDFYKLEDIEENSLTHFVFFMKEGTFECLATSYEERIPDKNM
jgi:hypothetical protein